MTWSRGRYSLRREGRVKRLCASAHEVAVSWLFISISGWLGTPRDARRAALPAGQATGGKAPPFALAPER